MSTNKILIIDLSFVFNRYHFVNKSGSYADPGIYGTMYFLGLIIRNNLKEFKDIYVVLDSPSKNHIKKQLYPAYKEGRGDKSDTVYKNWDDFLKILTYFSDKFKILHNFYHEADEIISAIAVREANKGNGIIIHSGDKDLLQLCGFPNIQVADKYKEGKFIPFTKQEINNKFKVGSTKDYGFISEDLKTLVLWKVFRGDSSDNIKPAIERFSYKDIKTVIDTWNGEYLDDANLADNIICNLESMELKHMLAGAWDNILLNYKLVELLSCYKDKSILKNTKLLKRSISKQDMLDFCGVYKINREIIGD